MSIPFVDGAVAVVYPFVVSLATTLSPVGGAATTIVLCTAALRLLLLPLALAAVRGERSRIALAPRVADLRRRHGKDPARLGTELTQLYRDAGISPFAGLLPLLLQSPAFIVWYRIFTAPAVAGPSERPAGVPVPRGRPVRPAVQPSAGVPPVAGRDRAAGAVGGAARSPGRCRDRGTGTEWSVCVAPVPEPAQRPGDAVGSGGVPGRDACLDRGRERPATARATGPMNSYTCAIHSMWMPPRGRAEDTRFEFARPWAS